MYNKRTTILNKKQNNNDIAEVKIIVLEVVGLRSSNIVKIRHPSLSSSSSSSSALRTLPIETAEDMLSNELFPVLLWPIP